VCGVYAFGKCYPAVEYLVYRRTGFNCENLIIANCEFF